MFGVLISSYDLVSCYTSGFFFIFQLAASIASVWISCFVFMFSPLKPFLILTTLTVVCDSSFSCSFLDVPHTYSLLDPNVFLNTFELTWDKLRSIQIFYILRDYSHLCSLCTLDFWNVTWAETSAPWRTSQSRWQHWGRDGTTTTTCTRMTTRQPSWAITRWTSLLPSSTSSRGWVGPMTARQSQMRWFGAVYTVLVMAATSFGAGVTETSQRRIYVTWRLLFHPRISSSAWIYITLVMQLSGAVCYLVESLIW